MRPFRVATRGSRLAMAQAEMLRDYLEDNGISVEICPITTTGDRILDRSLAEIGGKGLFVRELEQALRTGRCDAAVHSCKDLPMDLPPDLPILGFSRREDPRDVLVLPLGAAGWERSRPVGTGSRRRALQLAALYPGLPVAPVRGNVQTRLAKLDGGQFGALVLAAAGLKRLGLTDRIQRYFAETELLPAPGQGILCVQGRAGTDYARLQGFFDRSAALEARAERAFARALGGGCTSPVAALARCEGDGLRLRGLWYDAHGAARAGERVGPAASPEALGEALAAQLREGEPV